MMSSEDPYAWPVLTGQVPAHPWPECPDHREVQHRDRKPPWCNTCGWNRGQTIPPRQIGRLDP